MDRYKSPFLRMLTILMVFCWSGAAAWSQTFDALKKEIKTHVLGNGMKFMVLERHGAPVVSFHVYADVGSVNESYGITGISHLLEHMAFKGSKTVGTKNYEEELKILDQLDSVYEKLRAEENRLEPDPNRIAELKKQFAELESKAKEYVINNEYFDMMLREGDAGVNAYTSSDATQYINSLPSNRVEFWMAMTSDRFLNPVFREFYKEREVVMEERRLGLETQPTGRLIEDFRAVAFKAHPYRHHVVGHMSDLQSITRKDVEDYFRRFYSPSNLTAAVVGDVKAEEVFRLADLYFGRIPSGPKPEPVRTREPEQWGERRVTVSAQAQPYLIIGYHRPEVRHKDNHALEALADILGQGRSSRLFTSLVKNKKIAVSASTAGSFPGEKYPNLFVLFAIPAQGKSSAECLAAVEEEIEKVKKESVSEEELTKFKRRAIKNLLDQMTNNASMAALLTYAEVILGGYQKLFNQIDEIKALTAEDIRRVANKYLVKNNRTIGEIIPEP